MTLFQAIVLGLVQGLGEFLPISSSAHLALIPQLFGWDVVPPLSFDVALHLGTLVAVLIYFGGVWLDMIRRVARIVTGGGIRSPEDRRIIFLIVATIPGAIAGVLLEKQAETIFRSPTVIASTMIVMGIILWLVDRRASQSSDAINMTWKQALLIGISQAFALIPGVSRSGATITAGRSLGFSRESAALFSFLLSMPIILGAGIHEAPKILASGLSTADIVALVTAAVSGWIAIKLLMRFVQTHSYGVFAAYRVAVGVAVLIWVAVQ